MIDKILKKSLLKQNMNRIKEGRLLILKRKQNTGNELKLCRGYNGFFKSRLIGRHFASCPQADVHGNPTAVPLSVIAMSDTDFINKAPDTENFRTEVLSKFQMDRPGEICRTNKDLISVGYKIRQEKREKTDATDAHIIHEIRRSAGNEHMGLKKIEQKDVP